MPIIPAAIRSISSKDGTVKDIAEAADTLNIKELSTTVESIPLVPEVIRWPFPVGSSSFYFSRQYPCFSLVFGWLAKQQLTAIVLYAVP